MEEATSSLSEESVKNHDLRVCKVWAKRSVAACGERVGCPNTPSINAKWKKQLLACLKTVKLGPTLKKRACGERVGGPNGIDVVESCKG